MPAVELARRQLIDAGWHELESFDRFTVDSAQRVADRCAVSRRTIHRWLAGAQTDERTADRVAIGLGTHPLLLWPDEWFGE
jgi:hypothetical protein